MRLPLTLLLLAIPLSRAAGSEDDIRLGQQALADHLWDVAAIHFERLLSSAPLPAAEKQQVAMRLAEAWVRNGEPHKTLELLNQSFLAESPEKSFWKGQALAGLGRLTEAAGELEAASQPGQPYYKEAALTLASIRLSLNQPDEALEGLKQLSTDADPAVSLEAKMRQVEILLDLRRIPEARSCMPKLEEIPTKLAQEASYLEACLLLAEKKPSPAAERFFSLMAQPSGRNLRRHHAAVVGYADALAAQNRKSEALEALISFIQENPTSSLLDKIFPRLLAWLPQDLAPTAPVLARLAQWASPPGSSPGAASLSGMTEGLIPLDLSSVTGAWPVIQPENELAVQATFALAESLHRVPAPAQKEQSMRLLRQLALGHPQHPLAARAWLQISRWLMEDGKRDGAFAILDYLREQSSVPSVAGEAAFIQAQADYRNGNFKAADQLFEKAAQALEKSGEAEASGAARLNAAVSRFRETGGTLTVALTGDGAGTEDPALQANLELEQALATTPAEAAQAAIETFIKKHPTHPRVPEARLAAAEAALTSGPQGISYAKAQLDTIAEDPASIAAVPAARYALAKLRLVELSGDTPATLEAARAFIRDFPEDPSAKEAALTLGRTLYQSGSYNDAQVILQQLAADDSDPVRMQAALLLAASSAARVGTPQSKEEALSLFDKAGAVKGPLNALVMMKKAQLMIDLGRLAEATDFLRKWYHSLPAEDPLRLPSGFLFGDAAYAMGTKSPEVLAESLEIYDELLKHPQTKSADVHRIQYLRGKILEQLPAKDNPSQKRESEALAAYYSVLKNAENPPAEWHFLESSGFRALEILERSGEAKARAALNIAREIAALNGPRAKEAADRAQDIQLKNQIWED